MFKDPQKVDMTEGAVQAQWYLLENHECTKHVEILIKHEENHLSNTRARLTRFVRNEHDKLKSDFLFLNDKSLKTRTHLQIQDEKTRIGLIPKHDNKQD